jgi:hypothetical protein
VLGVSLAFRGRVVFDAAPARLYRRLDESLWAEHRTTRHLLAHARAVRRRIRADPGVPRWAKATLPLIAALQVAAVLVGRPVAGLLRRGRTE